MRALIIAGAVAFSLIVFLLGMMLPDTTEASLLNLIASAAESSKRAAMYNSIEVQALEVELEELRALYEQQLNICAAHLKEPPTMKQRASDFIGRLFGG